jgi:hypothetical protein
VSGYFQNTKMPQAGQGNTNSDVLMDSHNHTNAILRTMVSMHSPSLTPSVLSITSLLCAQLFRYEYRRSVNNYSEVYSLPADNEEIKCLGNSHFPVVLHSSPWHSDLQYELKKLLMGEKYPPMVEVLANNVTGETKAILDLGCGSGSWWV